MKNPPPFASVLESLEPKIAPATVIAILYNAGTNSLTVNGSTGNDDFIMTHTVNDTWKFTSADPDTRFTINGGAQEAVINNIPITLTTKINLGDGDDRVRLTAEPGASLVILEGLFEVVGGKGADNVAFQDELAPVFNGLTKFDFGDGDDTFQIEGSATFANKTVISTGAGLDNVSLGPFGTQSFTKGLMVDLGSGGGRFFTADLNVSGGKLEVKSTGGATSQVFLEGGLNVDMGVSINLGSATNSVALGYTMPVDIVIGGPLNIVTSGSTNTVGVTGGVKVSGAVTVDMKDGNSSFVMLPLATLEATSVLLKGGKSGLAVQLMNDAAISTSTFFTVDVKANTLSDNAFNLGTANALKIGTTFSYLGGVKNDQLNFGANAEVDIRGGMIASLGAGSNGVGFNDADVTIGGNLSVTGLTGADGVNSNGAELSVLGSVLINLGAGANGIGISGGTTFVGGSLSYTGGAGDDNLLLRSQSLVVGQGFIVAAGDGSNSVQFHSNTSELTSISYTGGKGEDLVYLGTNASDDFGYSTRVSGTITVKLGAGLNRLHLGETMVRGTMNVQSTSGATETDTLKLRDVTVFGALNAALGKGVSTLTLDDSTFNSAVNVTTGDGADVLQFDNLAGAEYGDVNRWNSAVKIVSGAGDDQFIFGTGNGVPSGGNVNVFRNFNSIFDSGTGTDTVQQNGGQTLSGNAYNVTVI